jgi:uncharacterized protein (TIGR00255 family)
MKSMTGYGRATAALGTATLTVVVSSVNRKTLDLDISLPEEWQSLETEIAEAVRRHAARGKINLRVDLSGAERDPGEGTWDEEKLSAALDKLETFAKARKVDFKLSPDLIWNVISSQRRGAELPDAEVTRPVLMPAIEEALRSFAAMRAKEGETLLVDFLSRVETLRRHMELIAQRAPTVPVNYRELLLKRLREAGLEIKLDDERVLKEIALFADRCDVTEEITRFRSHMDQFSTLIRSEGEIGRKAEFILQEMGREVNTTGSKANDIGISRNVIELKNELERIREQIANVE